MVSNFRAVIKNVIRTTEKMEDLSSFGWDRMKHIEKDLDAEKITREDAVKQFLNEHDSDIYHKLRKDFSFIKSVANRLR